MVYLDTSFLTPLFRAEETSAAIETFIRRLPPSEPAISHWTRVEFSSLLARDVRMGVLASAGAEQIDAQFETSVGRSFHVLTPDIADFDLAKRYLRIFDSGLRGSDALHLAIAHNNGATAIYTLDKTMLKAVQRIS
jgi:predicted nucleic acid-binding protein